MYRRHPSWTSPLIGLVIAGVIACSDPVETTQLTFEPGDVLATLATDEGAREFWLHIPPGLESSAAVPLVVAIHGAGGTPEGLKAAMGFDAEARSRGFIVAYPRGLERTWRVVGSQKDVDFLSGMVEQIAGSFPVDRNRVFAVGISQGALMTHRLGCTEAAFKGIGSVAASVSMLFENCTHPDPVPALFILGTADPIYPFDEAASNLLGHWGGVGGAEFWASRIGCTAEAVVSDVPDRASDGMTTRLWTYAGCPRGEVRLYGIEGGGHTWPGVDFGTSPLGPTTLDFDATPTMLDFLLGL